MPNTPSAVQRSITQSKSIDSPQNKNCALPFFVGCVKRLIEFVKILSCFFTDAAWAWPALMRIKDGSDVWEFVNVIPEAAQYEAQSAIVNGKIYALLRGAKNSDFYLSDDMGKSFRPIGRIDFDTTRPQLLPYRNKVLIAVSKKDVEPNYVRDGRNNLLLLCGEGDDLSAYKEVFHVTDPYGMVYYDIVDYKGLLFMFWSSADLYRDRNIQAKNLLWYTRIGEV